MYHFWQWCETLKIGIKMLGLVQHPQHKPCTILHQKNLRHGNKVLVSSTIFYSINFHNAQLSFHLNYVQSHQERQGLQLKHGGILK